MKKFLTKYRLYFYLFSFLWVYLFIILVIPTRYDGIVPYGLNRLKDNLSVDNGYSANDNSFYSISVYSINRVTPFQKMILDIQPFGETYSNENTNYISRSDQLLMGQIEKQSSYDTSIINAFENARSVDSSISITSSFVGVKLHYLPLNTYKKKDIAIGDIVTSIEVNGVKLNASDCQTVAQQKAFIDSFRNIKYEITIGTTKHSIDLSNEKTYINVYPIYEISTNPAINNDGLNSSTGGPSGGLLQTLYLYSTLLKLDYSQYKISGTGTLTFNAFVGAIGGIREKFLSATKANVNIFFVPSSNLSEIEELLPKYPQMKVLVVSTLQEALVALLGLNNA
jgi:PDZ domain-containing protein